MILLNAFGFTNARYIGLRSQTTEDWHTRVSAMLPLPHLGINSCDYSNVILSQIVNTALILRASCVMTRMQRADIFTYLLLHRERQKITICVTASDWLAGWRHLYNRHHTRWEAEEKGELQEKTWMTVDNGLAKSNVAEELFKIHLDHHIRPRFSINYAVRSDWRYCSFQKNSKARRHMNYLAHDIELKLWWTVVSIRCKSHEAWYLRLKRLKRTFNNSRCADRQLKNCIYTNRCI